MLCTLNLYRAVCHYLNKSERKKENAVKQNQKTNKKFINPPKKRIRTPPGSSPKRQFFPGGKNFKQQYWLSALPGKMGVQRLKLPVTSGHHPMV